MYSSLCEVSWCSPKNFQNAFIEKITDAGSKQCLVRLFSKRARSLDLKYTFWEVPSTSTSERHRQTQRTIAIMKKTPQNVTTKNSWCRKTPVEAAHQRFEMSTGDWYQCAVSISGQTRVTETVCWLLKGVTLCRHSWLSATCLLSLLRVLPGAKRRFLDTFSAVKPLSVVQTSSEKVPPRGPKTLLKVLEKLCADNSLFTAQSWGSHLQGLKLKRFPLGLWNRWMPLLGARFPTEIMTIWFWSRLVFAKLQFWHWHVFMRLIRVALRTQKSRPLSFYLLSFDTSIKLLIVWLVVFELLHK